LAIEVLGLSLLAAHFALLRRAARFLLIAGCAADFYFGVLLQARVESLENTTSRVVFSDIWTAEGSQQAGVTDTVSKDTWIGWTLKHRYQLSERLLIAIPQQYHDRRSFPQLWPRIKSELEKPLQEDAAHWGGWASRHGGVTSYLGDHVGGDSGRGTDSATVVFCLLFVGLTAALVKAAMAEPVMALSGPPMAQSAARPAGARRGRKMSRRSE
jgi:hypothetical protein